LLAIGKDNHWGTGKYTRKRDALREKKKNGAVLDRPVSSKFDSD